MATPITKDTVRSITVQGTGTVAVVPDMALVTTSVVTVAATARDAMADNTDRMRDVIATLRRQGIEARDIQTSQFYVQPQYAPRRDREPNRAPEIVGYEVTNGVTIRVRDIGLLGDVLDLVIQDGANRIGNISFDVSDADLRRDDARRAAMDDAFRKAKLLARAADAGVGDVLQISEQFSHAGARPMVAQARMASDAVPIEAGESTLAVTITVTWELR